MQLASILGENNVKLVPDIAVSGDGSGGLVNAMFMLLAGPMIDKFLARPGMVALLGRFGIKDLV